MDLALKSMQTADCRILPYILDSSSQEVRFVDTKTEVQIILVGLCLYVGRIITKTSD